MKKIIQKLNLDNEFTKLPAKQKIFNHVKNGVPPIANYNFEADLLYLPTDKDGFKYLLSCVDLATDGFDIEPIKDKSSESTVHAFKNMFKRRNIKKPIISIRTDNGTEFKHNFDEFLNETKNKIFHSVSLPYRHKQLANVENLNKQVGTILNMYMNHKEIETGEQYNEWTDILKIIRTELNKERKLKMPSYKNWNMTMFDPKTAGKPTYKINDIVHEKLEIPKNALNNKQSTTKFRVSDFRYSTTPKKIINVIYMPDEPYYRYMLEGMPNVSYSDNELMRANKTEKETKFEVEKFIKKKTTKGKISYLVKWKGYKVIESNFESQEKLIEDLGIIHFNKLVDLMKIK